MKRKFTIRFMILLVWAMASFMPTKTLAAFTFAVEEEVSITDFGFYGLVMMLLVGLLIVFVSTVLIWVKYLLLKRLSSSIEVDVLWAALSVASYTTLFFGSERGSLLRQFVPGIPILILFAYLSYSSWHSRKCSKL